MTNKHNTTLYIGVTNNLLKRVYQHKTAENLESFTARYNLNKLVYFEQMENVNSAIKREKQLKNWPRKWKNGLIIKANSNWKDLAADWYPNLKDERP